MTYRLPRTVRILLEDYRARLSECESRASELAERVAELEARLRDLEAAASPGGEPGPADRGADLVRDRDQDRDLEVERLRARVEELTRRLEELESLDMGKLEEDLLRHLAASGGWFDLQKASEELGVSPRAVMAAARSLASKGALILVEREG